MYPRLNGTINFLSTQKKSTSDPNFLVKKN